MASINALLYPIAGWIGLILLHNLLMKLNPFSYRYKVDNNGIRINWFSVRVFITRFNGYFLRLATLLPKQTRRWFNVGCFITIFSMPFSLILIVCTFWHLLTPLIAKLFSFADPKISQSAIMLQPVIPGVNLPLNDFFYYIISLILASGFHEFGHALAAARESVKIHGVGFFLCMFIPTAFVEIAPDQLLKISIWKRLKIISAGIWHNYVLGAGCALLLLLNPILLSPFYVRDQGVVVSHVDKASGVYGPFGLHVGDVITSINRECNVRNREEFKTCLLQLIRRPLIGYCVSEEFIQKEQYYSTIPGRCCGDDSKSNLCFERLQTPESSANAFETRVCLPARLMLSTYPKTCNVTFDCSEIGLASHFRQRYQQVAEFEEQRIQHEADSEEVHQPAKLMIRRQLLEETLTTSAQTLECIRPLVYASGVRLIELQRAERFRFLFYGFPSELFQAVSLIDYRPKYGWLPVSLLYHYETLLKYIVSFSFGLAVINLVPCYFLDGQWLIQFLVDFLFHSRFSHQKRNLLISILTWSGTLLLCSCLVLSLHNLLSVTIIVKK